MNSKFILSLIVVLSITTCLYSQEEKKVIDFENHLSISQIETIDKLIKESGVDIDVVFFNVNEILNFKLKDPRSIDEYVHLWKEENEDAVLILFSNIESDEDNYWTDNFRIISNFDVSDIITFAIQELTSLVYEVDGEQELQDKYYSKIVEIINLILNKKLQAVTINMGTPPFGAGFKFPKGFEGSDVYKSNPIEFNEEFAGIYFKVNPKYVKYLRVRIFIDPNNLVYENEIDINATQFVWDGKMNKGVYKDKYITKELCKYTDTDGSSSSFKIELLGSPDESFNLIYKDYYLHGIHKDIQQFLDVIKKKDNFHSRILLYGINFAPNQFRRYIEIRESLRTKLRLSKSEDPFQYLSENSSKRNLFCEEDDAKHPLMLHNDFIALINRLNLQNPQKKINFSKEYASGGGLYIRANVNNTTNLSDHSLGIAFDLDIIHNTNTSKSFEFKQYVYALTKTSIQGKLESSELKKVSDKIKFATSARMGANQPYTKYISMIKEIGENIAFLSSNFFNIKNEKYEPGYMIFNFYNSYKHDEWNTKFVKIQETTSAACNNSLIISDKSKKEKALLLCEELNNELYTVMSVLENTEKIDQVLEAYNNAFFLKEKYFNIDPLVENTNSIWYYIKTMSETIETFVQILNETHESGLNVTIFSPSYINHIYKNVNFTNAYTKTYDELLRIDHIMKDSYKRIGTMFMNNNFAKSPAIYLVFMHGFVNFKQTELDNWLQYEFLEWMGHNKNNKDAMHFQLKSRYKNQFFDDPKNFNK